MPDNTVGLTFTIHRTGSTIMVRCKGRLVSGLDDLLYNEVKRLLPGSKRIVLDLTDLTRLDSMGLGTLVRLYVSARTAGCSLELVNLGKQVWLVLRNANLLSAFSVVGEHYIKMG